MVSQPSSDPQRRNHLRLVAGASDAGRDHIQSDGIPVLSPEAARAKAIRKEAEALRASRSVVSTSVAPADLVSTPEPHEASPETNAPSVKLEELGSRFEALAPKVGTGQSRGDVERIDAALSSLRANSPLGSYSELWPAVHLMDLVKEDPSSAGRWLIALMSQLHRISPTALLDLRMASGQTIRAVALGDETRLDWEAAPARGVPFVKATEAKLASLALGIKSPRRRQRAGVELLRRLAVAPISLADLAASGTAVVDPYAFWRLIRVARPAVLDGIASRITHEDPFRPDYTVTVDLNPGVPLQIRLGLDPEADAAIETRGPELFQWGAFSELAAVGSPFLSGGDADAELAALRTIGRSNSPIRLDS